MPILPLPPSHSGPILALVGRPNVGKSTLFNRLAGSRIAIVENVPGVTRDRHYRPISWGRLQITLVDTGGLDPDETDPLGRAVGAQSLATLEQAGAVLFITDGRAGITPADEAVAKALRRAGVAVIHVVNKTDTVALTAVALEACELGFDPVVPVSAEHGLGMDDLYDAVAARMPDALVDGFDDSDIPEQPEFGMVRVAVVGRPNVGKSTLVNRLLGEDRLVVSNLPGTTRDAIDSVVHHGDTPYLFIDTAGIRRRGRIHKGAERAGVGRAMSGVERADVALIMMDGEEGITEQDTKIVGQILRTGRGCILVVNKWDTRRGQEQARARMEKQVARHFPFLTHAPVVFIAGLTGYRLSQLFPEIDRVAASFRRRVPTGELNRLITSLVERRTPPMVHHHPVRIYYATQVHAAPPRVVLFTNRNDALEAPYLRYLENGLREAFGFDGVPISMTQRRRERRSQPG